MRILQLCHKFPYPLKDGGAIAVTYLAKAYAALGHEVTLLSMNTSKHWIDVSGLPPEFNHYAATHTVFVENHIRPLPALRNLFFSKKSYHVERFDSPEFARKLAEVLKAKAFDVVQLESVFLSPYLPVIREHAPLAKAVLRTHNVEHEIWERIADHANPLKQWYLRRITPRLKSYELEQINHCDLVVGISQRDVAQFRNLGLRQPATVSPIGLDCRDYHPDPRSFSRPLSLSFIGSLDWMPNQEGLRWFLEAVWLPLLAPNFPELTFHIAGRTAPRWLRELKMERVAFHGEVPSAAEFLNQHSVMVVPLLSGGGMRAKILEGMAVGKVVLSTRLGIEGIEAADSRECLLAEKPEDWLEALRWCYDEGENLTALGVRARLFCEQHFDNETVARKLVEELERI
ncbi:MAG: glycosyltransferase [Saprospiraceae bacterium]|nr:glycosyltransferase [Saprospiraceae bacterium]